MNCLLFRHFMLKHGNTFSTLAMRLGLPLETLMGKLEEKDGDEFTKNELDQVITNYQIPACLAEKIFFDD